ncbi:carbonic anhydrase [Epithele typhae]|uniref:carbonic anhydrase n=1 Tax=Epithele typhae TaxID=378194 RepID=UPI0020074DE5|nr:carbonic anhydrase [Epithele typhae]KAH9915939.1 carbonic anhydrase [Epithele typhae]
MTQDYVLARLLSNNAQWAQDVAHADPSFFPSTAPTQSPKVLWIGCSDSRVPESVVTASKPGDIFVHRNIANQFHPDDDSALSVLTYAIEHVGVQHVVLVGHTNCGGAAACAQMAAAPPAATDSPLMRWLAPLVALARANPDADLTTLVEENVRAQVAKLAECPIVVNAWAKGKDVQVHGWVYELEAGRLRDVGCSFGKEGQM